MAQVDVAANIIVDHSLIGTVGLPASHCLDPDSVEKHLALYEHSGSLFHSAC